MSIMNSIYVICIVAAVAWSVAAKSTWPTRFDGRIVGGRDTSIEKHPHQVSLQSSGSGRHFCGGSILSSTVIVTAAHCVKRKSPEDIQIRAGTTTKKEGGVVINVEKIILHENYNIYTTDYDVAILKLNKPLPLSSTIQPIALPEPSETLTGGETATTTGWGRLEAGGSIPEILQELDLSIVSHEKCKSAYDDSLNDITDHMVCAAEDGAEKSPCNGDSGGPLVVNNKLHGIVSWGERCADPRHPGVFTRVTSVRSWIQSNTGL